MRLGQGRHRAAVAEPACSSREERSLRRPSGQALRRSTWPQLPHAEPLMQASSPTLTASRQEISKTWNLRTIPNCSIETRGGERCSESEFDKAPRTRLSVGEDAGCVDFCTLLTRPPNLWGGLGIRKMRSVEEYLPLLETLMTFEPPVHVFGGFAEDALLHGTSVRTHQ